MIKPIFVFRLLVVLFSLSSCGGSDSKSPSSKQSPDVSLSSSSSSSSSASSSSSSFGAVNGEVTDELLLNTFMKNNPAAYIPAQCYTKTEDTNGAIHNPCFACHTKPVEPNYIDDADFQTEFSFRPTTRANRWSNLFKDRTAAVSMISDAEIDSWVRSSNYFGANGELLLAEKLAAVPANWDFNRDGRWNGYVPDCYFNFDEEGFDKKPDGNDSGWRVFAYTPFLGTFWPTNGSTDDVLIRLPKGMQQNAEGQYSRAVYKLNLAIVESLINRTNVVIPATDETLYQVDLNRNGVIDIATEVVFDWKPLEKRYMSYVGKAKQLYEQGEIHIAGGLYPEGTEFLHSVRYIDISDGGEIQLAARLKELRYAYKHHWNTYSQLNNAAMTEIKEGDQFPERLREINGNPETGVFNSLGWTYQGFIEDKAGQLRPQSYEESLNCVGCHSGIGVTTDSSFAFPRRLNHNSFQAGWYHWSQKGLAGIPEPQWKDGTWEYTEYLKQNRSGNEFRTNDEVIAKFFDSNGELLADAVESLHRDITELLIPSPERARMLNKAYKVIVNEQSYIYGRDAHVAPLSNVWSEVPEGQATGIEQAVIRP